MNQPIKTGTLASFTVGDVVCPDVAQVLRQTGPELAVSGRVVYLSDSGQQKDHFAIVDVNGIHAPVIVPVSRLQVVSCFVEDDGATVAPLRSLAPAGDFVNPPRTCGVQGPTG